MSKRTGNIALSGGRHIGAMVDEAADKLTLVIEEKDGSCEYVDLNSEQAVRLAGMLDARRNCNETLDS